ncbi:MAG: hypothetical protein RL065_1058, partial [Bacteroidota bacterium]
MCEINKSNKRGHERPLLFSVFLFFLLMCGLSSHAQMMWEKTHYTPTGTGNRVYFHDMYELPNGNIVFNATDDYCFPCPSKNYLFLLAANGDSLWKIFPPNIYSAQYRSNLCVLPDGNFVWTVQNNMQTMMGKEILLSDVYKVSAVDGSILMQKHYDFYFDQYFGGLTYLIYDSTDNSIMWAQQEFFYKLDMNLDTTLAIHHNKSQGYYDKYQNQFFYMDTVNPGGLQERGFTYFDHNFDSLYSIAFPTTGLINFNGSDHFGFDFLIKNASGDYITALWDSDNLDTMIFMQIDSVFQLKWTNTLRGVINSSGNLTSCGPNGILENNGICYFIGFTNHSTGWSIEAEDAFITKIDSMGNIIFNRTYKAYDSCISNNSFYKIVLAADGGLILGGITSNYGNVPYSDWIVKTDSLGNTPFTSTIGFEEIDATKIFLVYPNPADNQIEINFEESISNYQFDLFNDMGKRIWSKRTDKKFSISVSELPNGLYLLRSNSGNKSESK